MKLETEPTTPATRDQFSPSSHPTPIRRAFHAHRYRPLSLRPMIAAPTASPPPRVGASTPLKVIQNDNALKARFSATLRQEPGSSWR
jgi:hypothetical protein